SRRVPGLRGKRLYEGERVFDAMIEFADHEITLLVGAFGEGYVTSQSGYADPVADMARQQEGFVSDPDLVAITNDPILDGLVLPACVGDHCHDCRAIGIADLGEPEVRVAHHIFRTMAEEFPH